jgi:hypothetical protein
MKRRGGQIEVDKARRFAKRASSPNVYGPSAALFNLGFANTIGRTVRVTNNTPMLHYLSVVDYENNRRWTGLRSPRTGACSAGFQTCRAADFQVGQPPSIEASAGLETCDTAGLEACATVAVEDAPGGAAT